MSRAHLHLPQSLGEHLADRTVGAMGSWRFIVTQTAVIVAWCTLNTAALIAHWDPYPWILLNLLFSTQAAYAAPLILMAGNRAAQVDRARDDHEAAEVEEMVGKVLRLLDLQDQQMQVLSDQDARMIAHHEQLLDAVSGLDWLRQPAS